MRQIFRLVDIGLANGQPLSEAVVVEVGTGWVPLLPCVFWLLGAEEVITVDLHRHLDRVISRRMIQEMLSDPWSSEELKQRSRCPKTLSKRMERLGGALKRKADANNCLFGKLPIQYLAPEDARSLSLEAESVDWCVSNVTLEHVPTDVLRDILIESRRILRGSGIISHLVDLSDHCGHGDRSISPVNFLRFSDSEWLAMAGRGTAYHNRLRWAEYVEILRTCEFSICQEVRSVSERGLQDLGTFELAEDRWTSSSAEELCCTNWLFAARKVNSN